MWLNPSNYWIYRHLHVAEERMAEVAHSHPDAHGTLREALDQMARELLLAQSSDWAFILTTGSTVPYAVRRTKDHLNRFTGLYEQVIAGAVNPESVREIRWRDPIFSEIDYRVYR